MTGSATLCVLVTFVIATAYSLYGYGLCLAVSISDPVVYIYTLRNAPVQYCLYWSAVIKAALAVVCALLAERADQLCVHCPWEPWTSWVVQTQWRIVILLKAMWGSWENLGMACRRFGNNQFKFLKDQLRVNDTAVAIIVNIMSPASQWIRGCMCFCRAFAIGGVKACPPRVFYSRPFSDVTVNLNST